MSTDVKTFTARESPSGGREDKPSGLKWNLTKHYGSRIPKGCGFPVSAPRYHLPQSCHPATGMDCGFTGRKTNSGLEHTEY